MIKTVLFVHGTGVRKASYEYTAARISAGLQKVAPTIRLEPCLWGDAFGAKLGMDGVSIPEFSRASAASPSEDQTLALWELLARDPLFELREMSATTAEQLIAPGEIQRKITFKTQVLQLGGNAAASALFQGRVLAGQWQQVVASVATSAVLIEAITAAPRVDVSLRIGVSRALVARLQQQLTDDNMPYLPAGIRDELIELCINELGGRDAGFVRDWVTTKLLGLGARWATAKARRQRDALFSTVAPTAGDVVLYQARGADIRDFIAKRIVECGGDVAVIAHSLGGIACVDLFIERPLPQVKLLVTAGSQAPFLYEIDALTGLRFGKSLPGHFPQRWLNFYDCNDLLSYSAARVWPGHAVDQEVQSGLPFPQSHSAYWDVPQFWQSLDAQLNEA